MQIPNSSPQRRLANETSSQNANSPSTCGYQASGSANMKEFKQVGRNPAITIPPGGWNCDILMIGGGAGANRGGGGAGACIVAINQTLPYVRCVVSVGNGGGEYTNGGDSSISVERSTTGKSPSGYYAYPGGGGGIGNPGKDNIDSNPDAGRGGDGLNAATINGITYNFKQHFGVDGYICGGGGDNGTAKNTGANGLNGSTKYSISYKSSHKDNLPHNTGSSGNGAFGAGTSGIVIIRVRTS